LAAQQVHAPAAVGIDGPDLHKPTEPLDAVSVKLEVID
jgi:hypothetical protein